ncbi:MAG TPA: DUF2017 domain-containing protein [Cryptosporangiaceae bacterium]|nr:DUF2017 domain-containing protein [Cryptosporangiaceae bacterium]
MTRGFSRSGDAYLVEFDADEAQAVALVVAQVAGLIQAESRTVRAAEAPGAPAGSPAVDPTTEPSGPASPEDPALVRLFPDGYRDDAESAAELRRLTQPSLRDMKVANASTVLDDLPLEGGEVRLDDEGAEAWLLAINDARLVLGTRLDLTDDTDLTAELDEAVAADPTSPRVMAISVYHYLSFLQETLIEAMDPADDR